MFEFEELVRLKEENDRLARRLAQREKQLEELIFDLSQETAARERLQKENARLQNKLARQKASIRGQEKLWLQTKVSLLSKITKLQEALLHTTNAETHITPVPDISALLKEYIDAKREEMGSNQ